MSTLEAHGIYKSFGAVEVLRGVSLVFHPGTVTAIVGDNGAGKSTFLKILAGVHRADRGDLKINGTRLRDGCPDRHRLAGIEMVYQDLALAKNQDVATNLFLGREVRHYEILDRREMAKRSAEILEQLAITIPDLPRYVGVLSVGHQQAI